jgi:hypothetical protein
MAEFVCYLDGSRADRTVRFCHSGHRVNLESGGLRSEKVNFRLPDLFCSDFQKECLRSERLVHRSPP